MAADESWEGIDSTDPLQVLRWELVLLWADLADAYRTSRAVPPETSTGCENLIDRIHRITRVVGPIPPEHVEMPFLLTGMYERVHAATGVTVTVPDDLLARCREYLASQTGQA